MKSIALGWIGVFNLLLATIVSGANFSIDLLTDNIIPSRCQLNWKTCGAAVAQMALQGYPGNVDHVVDQLDLYSAINLNNEGIAWWTEPGGMEKTLMQFGGDPGVHWKVFAEPDAGVLMYEVAYWMENRRFPVPVVVDIAAHWVLITGYDADAAPSTTNPIGVQTVYIIQPDIATAFGNPCSSPDIGGSSVTIPYDVWTTDYWYAPIDVPPSKWTGKFVAVIEPPIKKGYAKSTKQQIDSGTIIVSDVAADAARAWLDAADTSDKSRYRVLRYAQVQTPMLVNAKGRAYFIVPIGDKGTGISDGAILINAYSGELQEIAVFSRARRYLSEQDAMLAALKAAGAQTSDLSNDGELIFRPSDQAQSRIFPLWKFLIRGKPYYVSQSVHVYNKLTLERAGN